MRLFGEKISAYRLKRAMVIPYVWCMRFKERRITGMVKSVLEVNYYRPTVYRYLNARYQNSDLECAAPNVNANSIVFDVGAFDGSWAQQVFQKYGATVCCFEIDPEMSQTLADRFKTEPRVRCYGYGLSAANAALSLMRAGAGQGSTLHAEQGAPGESEGTIDVVVRDIAEVMDELKLSQIDWMKINIEGAEYDLLDRMIEKGRLADVVCFNIQFHEWFDGAHGRRRKIRNALKKTHRLIWDYPFIWEQWLRK